MGCGFSAARNESGCEEVCDDAKETLSDACGGVEGGDAAGQVEEEAVKAVTAGGGELIGLDSCAMYEETCEASRGVGVALRRGEDFAVAKEAELAFAKMSLIWRYKFCTC